MPLTISEKNLNLHLLRRARHLRNVTGQSTYDQAILFARHMQEKEINRHLLYPGRISKALTGEKYYQTDALKALQEAILLEEERLNVVYDDRGRLVESDEPKSDDDWESVAVEESKRADLLAARLAHDETVIGKLKEEITRLDELVNELKVSPPNGRMPGIVSLFNALDDEGKLFVTAQIASRLGG